MLTLIGNAFFPLLLLLSSAPATLLGSQAAANPTVDHPPRPSVPPALQSNPQSSGTAGSTINEVRGAAGLLQNAIWQYYFDGRRNERPGIIGGAFAGYFTVLADFHSITFDYSIYAGTATWSGSVLSLPPTIYNGIAVTVPSARSIRNVTIDPATNMVGFDATRISFKAGRIEVDWQNLSFDSSTIVKLDVE